MVGIKNKQNFNEKYIDNKRRRGGTANENRDNRFD
jgi:hypothetical protein